MSEPSKEAVAKALGITSRAGFTGTPEAFEVLATSLQELMDERDAYDRTAAGLHDALQVEARRAEAAEAKLAECVRRVREWNAGMGTGHAYPRLEAILDDYVPKTECSCVQGNPGDYEGESRDCPLHGEPGR